MVKRNKTIAVVQGTVSDLYNSDDPADYCVNLLKNYDLFDDIVIAAPHSDSDFILRGLAEKWGVKIFFGQEYDVADRFYQLAIKYQADVLVRIQLRAFYVDIELVRRLTDALGDTNDYVDVDNETNYALGADVFTLQALKKVIREINKISDNHQKRVFQFSPWAMLNNPRIFNVGKVVYREYWDKRRVLKLKTKLGELLNGNENKQAVEFGDPGGRYKYIHQFIEKNDIVLDIACGQGGGTAGLALICRECYGIDYNKTYIENAKKKYTQANLHYHYGNEGLINKLEIKFDKIVSLHTLEHVNDDLKFLQTLRGNLKQTGKLIIEVPRLLKYPLGEPLFPFHRVEYNLDEMKQKLEDVGFEIALEKGGNRNLYVDVEYAREVLFFICRQKN